MVLRHPDIIQALFIIRSHDVLERGNDIRQRWAFDSGVLNNGSRDDDCRSDDSNQEKLLEYPQRDQDTSKQHNCLFN